MPDTDSDVGVFAGFTRELELELVAAHGRLQRRRRRHHVLLSVAAAIVLACVAGSLLVIMQPTPVAAGMLRIDRQPDGSVQITVVGDAIDTARITAELEAAGIANTTTGLTTGPSRVGTIVAVASLRNGAQINHSPRAATLPPGFAGELLLTIGLPARGNEPYEEVTSPFDPGEPLAGFEQRTDARAILAAATARKLRVQLVDLAGTELATTPPGAQVVTAAMIAADTVRLRLAM